MTAVRSTGASGPAAAPDPAAAVPHPVAPVPTDREALARRLASPGTSLHGCGHDGWYEQTIPPGVRVKHAAVLIPLVERATGTQVLLTQRTSHLHDHAGQISFPGGRVEPGDRHREDTALRETEEEIGLAPSRIEVLGALPDHEMQSGFCITPVVGWIVPPYDLAPDPFEVQDVFEAPLDHVRACANYQRRRYAVDGFERRYLAIPWEGRYIWGATAAMLYLFHRILRSG